MKKNFFKGKCNQMMRRKYNSKEKFEEDLFHKTFSRIKTIQYNLDAASVSGNE